MVTSPSASRRCRGVALLYPLIGLLSSVMPGAASSTTPFTVRDSIRLTKVLDVNAQNGESASGLFSPDQSYLLIHTRRGDLTRNVNVETLLLFDVRDIRTYLSSSTITLRPRARTLVSVDARQPWEGISHIAWEDNQDLCFIAKAKAAVIQVFSINVRTGRLTQLTHSRSDVVSFALGAGRVVYYARASSPNSGPRHVAWQSFGELINPDGATARSSPLVELFVESRSGGNARRMDMPVSRLSRNFQRIWIAPAGEYAVGFRPAVSWPSNWADYKVPHYDLFGYSPDRLTGDSTSPEVENRTQYQLIDLRSGSTRPLLNAPSGFLSLNDTPAAAYWPRDHRSVIVTNTFLPLDAEHPSADEDRRLGPAIAEIDVASGTVTEITPEPYITPDVERGAALFEPIVSVEWDSDRDLLTVRRRGAGREFSSQSFRKVNGFWRAEPGRVDSVVSKGDLAVSRREGLNERPRLYVQGGACACSKVLYDPNPDADRFAFGHTDVLEWTDANGIAWRGGLVYPTDYVKGSAYPVVVQTHGFNTDEFLVDGPDGYTTAFAAQALANVGILVLQVEDNRQAMTLDEREGPRYAEGIHAAIEKLIADHLADPGKIGLICFSRTGWHTLHLLKRYPHLLAAVTMADAGLIGYTADMLSVNFSKDFRMQFRKVVGGTGQPADWIAKSPMYELSSIRTPVRLEANDPGSAVATWEMYALLRSSNRPVDFVYFPKGNHILFSPADRLESQGGNVDWFRFWLQAYEDPTPEKAAQYRRWRELRRQQD